MNFEEIRTKVLARYALQYPTWKDVRVQSVVSQTFDGSLAVVTAIDEHQHPNEELCFVYNDGTVRIFATTVELARFLEQKGNVHLLERMFSRSVFTGSIIALLTLLICIVGSIDLPGTEKVLTILGSVLTMAAGYYFGASAPRP